MNKAGIIAFLVISAITMSDFGSLAYDADWFALMAAFSIYISIIHIGPRVGWGAASLFSYAFLNGLWASSWRENMYFKIEGEVPQLAVRFFAMDSALKLVAVLIPLLLMSDRKRDFRQIGRNFCIAFCFFSSCMALYSFFKEGCGDRNSCGGALLNPSMNAGLLAVCLPIALKRNKYWIALGSLVITAIFLSKSSVGMGLLVLGSIIWATFHGRRWITRALMSCAILGILGFAIAGQEFTSSNGRTNAWHFFMSKWYKQPRYYENGMGFGTFPFHSNNLQRKYEFDKILKMFHWWQNMHNDWLEILFELGTRGLSLAVFVYFAALLRIYQRREIPEFVSLIMLGAYACVDYPGHLGLSAVFGAWLLIYCLRKKAFVYRGPTA